MKLSPTTLMGKEESKKIKTIIQNILDKPESFDFQNPVDWKGISRSTQPSASPTTPLSSKTPWTSAPATKNSGPTSIASSKKLSMISNSSGTTAKPTIIPKRYQNIYTVDLQNRRKPREALQKNGQELPSKHTYHCPRQYFPPKSGQTGTGRNDERKPVQNNLF